MTEAEYKNMLKDLMHWTYNLDLSNMITEDQKMVKKAALYFGELSNDYLLNEVAQLQDSVEVTYQKTKEIAAVFEKERANLSATTHKLIELVKKLNVFKQLLQERNITGLDLLKDK